MLEEMTKQPRILIACRAGVKKRLKACLPYSCMSPVLADVVRRNLDEVSQMKVSGLSRTEIIWEDRVYINVSKELWKRINGVIPSRMKTAVISSIIEGNLEYIESLSMEDMWRIKEDAAI